MPMKTLSNPLRLAIHSACALALLIVSFPSFAYYLMGFDPESPVEGDLIQLVVVTGCQDSLFVFSPQDRVVEVHGDVVRVEALGADGGVILCTFPTTTTRLDLLPLAAGTYRVELYRRTTPPIVRVDLRATGTLVVGPAPIPPPPAHPIPAMDSTWLLGGLLALVALIGARRARG